MPTGRPGSQFRREQNPLHNSRTLTSARAPVATEATPGRASSEPGPPGGRAALGDDFSDATRHSGSQDSQLAGRGEGARADAHIPRPRPTPLTKWALSGPLSPRPQKQRQSPQKGSGRGGEAKAASAEAQRVPSRPRLSGRTASTWRRAAPAEPSQGTGPAAQRDQLGRLAGARLRSPSGGLRPRGRCLALAAAWAVARPGRAKDAPWLFAWAAAALAEGGGRTAGRGPQARRLAQPRPADVAGGE